jgi:hypothetical protein
MLNTPENIFNIPFGGVIINLYLCGTLPVDNPDGAQQGLGRVDGWVLHIFLLNPAHYW